MDESSPSLRNHVYKYFLLHKTTLLFNVQTTIDFFCLGVTFIIKISIVIHILLKIVFYVRLDIYIAFIYIYTMIITIEDAFGSDSLKYHI